MFNEPIHLEADFKHLRGRFAETCRREVERYRFGLGTLGYLTYGEDGSTQEVWLVDFSEKGIGFYSDWPLDRGTALNLSFWGHADQSITLTAKVVHATKRTQGDWLIGCEFSQRLNAGTLESLL